VRLLICVSVRWRTEDGVRGISDLVRSRLGMGGIEGGVSEGNRSWWMGVVIDYGGRGFILVTGREFWEHEHGAELGH
jgi:hypothetical protein